MHSRLVSSLAALWACSGGGMSVYLSLWVLLPMLTPEAYFPDMQPLHVSHCALIGGDLQYVVSVTCMPMKANLSDSVVAPLWAVYIFGSER